MAAIVHFSKQDETLRTGTAGGTTEAEVTEYTVAWADLTGAGFANGDDVIVFIKANLGANSAANNAESTFGVGSTFAGRAVLQTNRTESGSATTSLGAREICFLDRLTLATNDNFYTSIRIIATSTPNIEDYCFFIMKLDDLAADDFRYAETAPSGDAPDTATDGASVTLPASGGDDWLVLGNVHWLVDTLTEQMHSQLSLGGNVRMTNTTEGEDTAEQFGRPLIGYLAGAANSAVCTVQYLDAGAGTNDVTRTAIFALRMEAFADHVGQMDQDAIAMGGVIDTYVQTNTVSLALSATGPVAWFAQTIADVGADAQGPYHRVQVDGADIVSALGRRGSYAYDITDQACLTQFGTISMSSGTRVIDVDCAEDTTATAYNFDEHTLVAFSMELAAAGPTVRVLQDLDSAATVDDKVMLRARDRESLDTLAVNDALNRAVIRPKTLAADYIQYVSDALWIPDVFSYAKRIRNRESLDTSVLLDDKTATYVPDAGSVINNRTLQDLASCAAVDDVIELRERNRAQTDACEVVDFDVSFRLAARTTADNFAVSDASVSLRERNRSQFDTFDLTDALVGPVISTVLFDSITVTDNAPITLRERNNAQVDSFTAVDGFSAARERNRTPADDLEVSDGVTATTSGVTINSRTLPDSLTVTDNHISLRYRNRVDAESLSVTDNSLSLHTRQKQLTDSIDVSETQASVRERILVLSDSINVTDSFIVTAPGQIKQVTDYIDVSDSLVATYIRDLGQFYITHGVEDANFGHGLERVHFLVGLSEETI